MISTTQENKTLLTIVKVQVLKRNFRINNQSKTQVLLAPINTMLTGHKLIMINLKLPTLLNELLKKPIPNLTQLICNLLMRKNKSMVTDVHRDMKR